VKPICPYCKNEAVEMTTSEDPCRRYLCLGPERHRFTEPFEEFRAEGETPLIILP